MPKKINTTANTPSKLRKVEDSDEELDVETSPNKHVKSKVPPKKKDSDEEKEDSDEDVTKELEVSSDEEDNNSDDEKKRKPNEKKAKKTFKELSEKLESLYSNIKEVEKEVRDLEKQTDIKGKQRRDFERQVMSIMNILLKTHTDEVARATKSKPKRKNNPNSGFNKEHPVPEILRDFLGIDESVCLPRPKVMSLLNNKFSVLGLKNGQVTTLNEETAKALGLGKEGKGKEIKFTEFQSFLATFYPKKEEKKMLLV